MTLRAYGGPLSYVQGPGALAELGHHLTKLGAHALLVMDGFIWQHDKEMILDQLAPFDLKTTLVKFGGESSDAEVARCIALGSQADVVVGIGGGKTLDTAKMTAFQTAARIVTVPTIASTDSPTSSIGVIYSPEGVYDRVVRGYRNPDLVLVDSSLIIKAPVRFLAAGMGDALATWFEARSNLESHSANYIADGYQPTLAGIEIAKACHNILLRDGRAAYIAASAGALTPAVENIIEANTLLSGLGFENCGVSGAHGIHDALTILEPTHHFFHGEKVAFGLLCLLVLENRTWEELESTIRLCRDIHLPTTLHDLGLEGVTDEQLLQVGQVAMDPSSVIHSVPVNLSAELIAAAIKTADRIAQSIM